MITTMENRHAEKLRSSLALLVAWEEPSLATLPIIWMQVLGADVVDLPDDTDTSLDAFISIPTSNERPALGDVTAALVQGISDALADGEEIDAIICAQGGWQGDPPLPKPDVSLEEFIRGAKEYGENIDKMMQMNLNPVLAANYAANMFMAEEGKQTQTLTD
jgi:hypothetical protein